MSEAEKLCDRIGIIHQGQILALGTLEEHRQATGKHYLEDVFVHEVMQAEDQSAKATASSSVSGDPGTSL
jgi:ABC-type multidrug transport system ATPase subunit